MLTIFRESVTTGIVTRPYPDVPDAMPPAARGTPELRPDRCRGHGACAEVCPSGAIALAPAAPRPPQPATWLPEPGDPHYRLPEAALDQSRTWQIDYGRCVFCGLCAEVCPEDAIAVTGRYELAALHREDLIVRVRLPGEAAAVTRAPEQAPGGAVETLMLGGAPPPEEKRASVQPRRWAGARFSPQSNGPVSTGAGAAPRPSGAAASAPSTGGTADTALAVRLRHTIRAAFRRSLHVRHVDAGSDNAADWELTTLLGPVYDVQRLGIDFVASPRHADVLAVTGPVTRGLEAAVLRTYEATPDPKLVVAVGTAACGGDVVEGSYAVAAGTTAGRGGVDRVIPVDVFIPGDPPRPQAIIYGLLLAVDRIKRRPRQG